VACAQKKAAAEQRTIVFADESGFYLLPGVVRTYAPCAHTPVLRVYHTRDHLSAMSGITPHGELYTLLRDEPLTGCESVCFMKHLLKQIGTQLLLIWDGSPIHRCTEVKTFLAEGGAPAIHLERLPPYAPDLNADEGVWQHLKHVALRNVCCANLPTLQHELQLAIRRLRAQPPLIQSFFAGAGLTL
jgi:transposase